MKPSFDTDKLAFETRDALMSLAYTNWFACAALLGRLGFSKEQARIILYHKWMRLASDGRKGSGRPTSADLKRFLKVVTPENLAEKLKA